MDEHQATLMKLLTAIVTIASMPPNEGDFSPVASALAVTNYDLAIDLAKESLEEFKEHLSEKGIKKVNDMIAERKKGFADRRDLANEFAQTLSEKE